MSEEKRTFELSGEYGLLNAASRLKPRRVNGAAPDQSLGDEALSPHAGQTPGGESVVLSREMILRLIRLIREV
jgi:hypothetical protein